MGVCVGGLCGGECGGSVWEGSVWGVCVWGSECMCVGVCMHACVYILMDVDNDALVQ